MSERVLITGARGVIGSVVSNGLRDHYDCTLTDLVANEDLGIIALDVSDYTSLKKLVNTHNVVLHLARDPSDDDKERPYTVQASAINYTMTSNIYRAALEAQTPPRLVMASSVRAVGGNTDWAQEPFSSLMKGSLDAVANIPLLGIDVLPIPDSVYAAQKIYMESLGRALSQQGVEVVCLRLGGVNPEDRVDLVEPNRPPYHPFWLSHRDCVHLFERAIEASLPRFSLFYSISNNRFRIYDLEHARTLLGYNPQDDSAKLLTI